MKNLKTALALGAFTALILVDLMTPAFVQAQISADQNPANPPQKAQDAGKEGRDDLSTVVKSYSLKYVDASEIAHGAASKFLRIENIVGNVLTVSVLKNKVQELDELIKQLDVEKKSILFRIYTVMASRKAPNDASLKAIPMTALVDDPELKRVLDELKGLWNFKSYRVESPSFMTAKDRPGYNFLRLISEWTPYNLIIMHPQIRGEEPGKRLIYIKQIQLIERSAENSRGSTIIDAEDISLKEKGILVVGVGGMPVVGAVILIISAEIK
ncbi:MAG: hypothetical protein ABSA30_01465 [Candidatus Aminicenantales bacterium]